MHHTIETSIHPPYLWKESVTDPYLLLYQFFDYTSIELQHLYTEEFVNAACTASYVKGTPGQLLSWYEKTTMLFYAADLVHRCDYEKDIDLGIDVSKLSWKEQPHYLKDYEANDPYITIESFFEFMSYDQWLIELHTWLHAALYEHTVLEETDRSPETIMLLHKLADAMWLLHLKAKQDQQQTTQSAASDNVNDEEQEEGYDDEPVDAITAVQRTARAFFDVQEATSAKADIWAMTKLAVCHQNDPDPVTRDNMLYMYELLCGIIDVLDKLNASNAPNDS